MGNFKKIMEITLAKLEGRSGCLDPDTLARVDGNDPLHVWNCDTCKHRLYAKSLFSEYFCDFVYTPRG